LLPIVLNQDAVSVGLIGAGDALSRRQTMLAEAGITPIAVSPNTPLDGLNMLFVAGLERDLSERMAGRAREQGILVNVEDVPDLCDFHVPAAIRRGDLVLTVSTGGQSPGLAKLIREWLERKLGFEWNARLKEVAGVRAKWREQGHAPSEVARRTRDFVRERDWLS
jgi:precorrin-2 dehydrogenase/sirohydrochlorin ferrochelatase